SPCAGAEEYGSKGASSGLGRQTFMRMEFGTFGRFGCIISQSLPRLLFARRSSMSRSLSRFQAIVLGCVVLAGLLLAGWSLFQIGSRQGLWAETYELRAGFTQIDGIERGTPVHVRGIEAGQVIGMELPSPDDPDGKVYLRLRLDKKFQPLLCADAKARISSEGVFGSDRTNIETGRDVSRRLQDGDEIATAEVPQLTDLLQEIRESNGTIAKLVKSDEAHKEVVELVKNTQAMVKQGEETFRQTQDAIREGKDT